MIHILETATLHESEPTGRVILTLQLVTLAVRHRLTLTLAKLTQHMKVNTVIAEFLFHKSVTMPST
jgi:hypothetical protein